MNSLVNVDAERGVIGSVLANNLALKAIPRELSAECFAYPIHQRIWQAIRDITTEGGGVDAATLRHRFADCEELRHAGGGDYLRDLAFSSITVINIKNYTDILMNLAGRRKLIELSEQMREDAANSLADVKAAEVAANSVNQLRSIIDSAVKQTMFDGNSLMELLLDDYKRQVKPTSTGLHKLDVAMGGGLYAGFMYGLGGRKKIGKTMLVATLSANLARQKIKHMVICAEMHPKEVYMRMLGSFAGCGTSAFRNGSAFSDDNLCNRILKASKEISEYCLFVAEPGIAFTKLREVVASAQSMKGVQGYILDYWQLVGGKEAGKGQVEHLDSVAQWIADYGRRNNIWSVVMSQLNQDDNTRGGEGLRLACDQLYFLKPCGDGDGDINMPIRWLQMAESRYTEWMDMGGAKAPYLELINGTHFQEIVGDIYAQNFFHSGGQY